MQTKFVFLNEVSVIPFSRNLRFTLFPYLKHSVPLHWHCILQKKSLTLCNFGLVATATSTKKTFVGKPVFVTSLLTRKCQLTSRLTRKWNTCIRTTWLSGIWCSDTAFSPNKGCLSFDTPHSTHGVPHYFTDMEYFTCVSDGFVMAFVNLL